MKNIRYISAFIVLLLVVLWTVLGYKLLDVSEKEDFYGFYVGKEIKEHTLTSHTGSSVSLSDYKGEILLVNFGYTHCPDICPTTLGHLRGVLESFGEKKDQLRVLFITIDPERDDPERLKKFVPYFHSDFVGLTGSTEEIKAVADDFNLHYFKEQIKSENDYLMSHGTSLYVVDGNGTIVLKYPAQMIEKEKIVEDIQKVM